MSACEICWEKACLDALLMGGYTVDHYDRRIREDHHKAHPYDNKWQGRPDGWHKS